MDLLEIDPKLFITCRLCLEDIGVYQIVPTVQQQIKFCFEIDVQPFDGLPQLLCKKCHTLLSEYSSVKKSFNEKQVTLKEKLMFKKEEPSPEAAVIENNQENVTSHAEGNVSSHCEVNASAQKKKFSKSKRRKRVLSSSSTDSVNSLQTLQKGREITPNNSSTKTSAAWKKKYTKYYVCKICSLMYKDKKSVKSHYYAHSYLKANHHKVFNAKCMVSLSKLDNKPNVTGLNNTVVFSKNRIIQDDKSSSYHILYIAKSKQYSKSDSSDCEIFVSSKQNKRRRLDSLSSNETILIGNNNKIPATVDTTKESTKATKPKIHTLHESKGSPICINLDDSSDSNMDASISNVPKQNNTNAPKVDMKTVENIVTVCRNKYEMRLRKSQSSENDSSRLHMDSQLKHKLLSFGRKVINTQGFNSTGLLRYLEHKNLNVIWEPMSQKKAQSAGREHSFIRLGAIMMNHDQRVEDDSGWIDVGPTPNKDPSNSVNQCVPQSSNTTMLSIIPTSMSVVLSPPLSDGVNQIVLSDIRSIEENNSKKLLNVNPVANPKQLLPKKSHTHDAKPLLVTKLHNNDQHPVNLGEKINELNLVMPVITSTKSLAVEMNNETRVTGNHNHIDKTAPRIKVKPVSELMNPQKVSSDHQNHIWNFNQIQNGTGVRENSVSLFVPNVLINQIQSQSTPVTSASSATTDPPKSISDYIILDTVDMPNTKTESPFEYFRNLLLLHGLVLIEANAEITREYICLLKFKVQFKQENKCNPVTLCLSLHCSGNNFCMSIRDGNQINIHIAKMSANWQWEIIKVYQGEVSNKILLNAQKAGQNIYTNTNTFICLLKSITIKQNQ